jgi:hypothetical protein
MPIRQAVLPTRPEGISVSSSFSYFYCFGFLMAKLRKKYVTKDDFSKINAE